MISKTIVQQLEKTLKDIVVKKYDVKPNKFVVDKTKDNKYGDFFSNIAMTLASLLKKNPIQIANEIQESLSDKIIEKVEVAPPGYLNIFLSDFVKTKLLKEIIVQKDKYGQFKPKNIFYNIEFVSANPTGSLHIGHARNAALGQTISNIWRKFGIKVEEEYYINDAGNQINILGMSVFYRYLELCGKKIKMEKDYYQGNEPKLVAKSIFDQYKDKYANCSYDATKIEDKKVFDFFKTYSKTQLMEYIKKDLSDFKIKFNRYFPESKIYEMNLVEPTLKKLGNNIFEKDNALWLKTTKFGDDKDRVVIKSDKSFTYFMPDIAFHNIKLSRNKKITKIFNIWGADHGSYVERMTIALRCLGYKEDVMHVIVMQMVKLLKNGEEFKMSKRSGNSLTLRDLIDAIGVESARWALVSQAADTHIEIDVDKFANKSHDNNLFYVLYAYARIFNILKKAKFNPIKSKLTNTDLLKDDREKELINMLFYYPHTIANIASNYEVQKLPTFLYNFANIFHSYYNDIKILDDSNQELYTQRLNLLYCVNETLKSGLALLDIKPKSKI